MDTQDASIVEQIGKQELTPSEPHRHAWFVVSLSVAMPLGFGGQTPGVAPSSASLVQQTTQGTAPVLGGLGIGLGAVSPGGGRSQGVRVPDPVPLTAPLTGTRRGQAPSAQPVLYAA